WAEPLTNAASGDRGADRPERPADVLVVVVGPLDVRDPAGAVADRPGLADDRVDEMAAVLVDRDAAAGDVLAGRAADRVDLPRARTAARQRARLLDELVAADAVGAVLPRLPLRTGLAPVEALLAVLARLSRVRVDHAQAVLVVTAVNHAGAVRYRRVGVGP